MLDLSLLFELMLLLTSVCAGWTALWLWWHARFQPVLKPLAGFCAMAPDTRTTFKRSLGLLASSQLAQLFGPEGHTEHITLQDWADDPWTCSDLDRTDLPIDPPQADPLLRRAH